MTLDLRDKDAPVEAVPVDELVNLCAVDNELYCSEFFPQTIKQRFAPFHFNVWNKLESDSRLINQLLFRGSGKTSMSRLFTTKRIAYGISRMIVYIGKNEPHAIRSTNWIKKHVEHNQKWRDVYHIRPGSRWQDIEFEIIVGPNEIPVWVMASGIEGSIRGINRDDARPDLIVLDDVLDDENAHTPERRKKINDLVYGALLQSLAPPTEAPAAKMVGLNTPQNKEDFAVQALKDPAWVSEVQGCFTKETAHLPAVYQKSAWPERFTTEYLRGQKQSYISRNMLATWLREMECKLTSPESSSFKSSWLKRYVSVPERLVATYAIDPVPPPSKDKLQKGLHKSDFEAHVVWGALGEKRFLLDYALMRGHEPTWTVKTFFEMQRKWHPIMTLVESVAYQRVLVWVLQTAMNNARQWWAINEYSSQQAKFVRIVNAHNAMASKGYLHVRDDQVEFIEQFTQYPDVGNDDLLDASAIALSYLSGLSVLSDGSIADTDALEAEYRPLNIGHAP